jgi:hypothetical protein
VSGDDQAYWKQLMARWDGTETLVVVEHDMELHAGVLTQFAECPAPWCTFPYLYWPDQPALLLTNTLGCAKFSAECQRAHPLELMEAARYPELPGGTGDWRHCETRIAMPLRASYGSPCLHAPPVLHHPRS